MSSTVPVFKIGERCQVMNTTTASEMGIQNLRGTINGNPGLNPIVALDRGDLRVISASLLVHISPEDEARWAKNSKEKENE